MKDKVYLYPIWVRLWHLTNALLFLLLLATGLSLQYSSTEYTLIPFNYAISLHNIAGIAICCTYALFIVGNRFTSNGHYYQFPIRGMVQRVYKQLLYYSVGIFTKQNAPFPISIEQKFNPLQKLSYVFVMYLFMPIMMLTGVLLFFPETLPAKVLGFGGVHFTALIHIISGFILSVFMFVHIYFCTIGKTPLANFKSMINGWH